MKTNGLKSVLLAVVCLSFAVTGCNKAGEGKDNEPKAEDKAKEQPSEAKGPEEKGKYDKYDPEMAAQAEQTARTFFEACAKEDWEAANEVAATYFDEPKSEAHYKGRFGGVEIIELGKAVKEAFDEGESKGKFYPGYFVPYKVKTKDGEIREHRIAVRNDPPSKKWRVDGGI